MRTIDTFMRATHLVFGLFAGLMLLMYSVSSLQMVHVPWTWQDIANTQITVPAAATESPRSLALVLVRDHGLKGELRAIGRNGQATTFQLLRPGRLHQVTYEPGGSTARAVTRDAGLLGTLNRIHHVNGLWHEDGLINAWGVMVLIVSVLLFGLGVTGLWLWFRIHEERVIGGVILAAGLVVGGGLVVAMRLQA